MAGQKREARLGANVPAIHVLAPSKEDVDARDKPGHDDGKNLRELPGGESPCPSLSKPAT